jgi:hypothetical protein
MLPNKKEELSSSFSSSVASLQTSPKISPNNSPNSSCKQQHSGGCVVLVDTELHAVGIISALRASNQSQRRYQRASASYTSSLTQFDNLVTAQAQKISLERDKEIAMEVGPLELGSVRLAKRESKDEVADLGGRRIKAVPKIEGGRPVPKMGALELRPDRPLTIHHTAAVSLEGDVSSDDEDGWDMKKCRGPKVDLKSFDERDDYDSKSASTFDLHIGEHIYNEEDEEIFRGFVPPRISAFPPSVDMSSSLSQSIVSHSDLSNGSKSMTTTGTSISGRTGIQGIKDLSSLRSSVLIKPGQRIRVRPGGRKALLANQIGGK